MKRKALKAVLAAVAVMLCCVMSGCSALTDNIVAGAGNSDAAADSIAAGNKHIAKEEITDDPSGDGKTPLAEDNSGGQSGSDGEKNTGHLHSFGDWKTIKEPDCTNEGIQERYCECGEKETSSIAPLGHDLEKISEKQENSMTVVTYRCRRCSETVSEMEPLTNNEEEQQNYNENEVPEQTEYDPDESAEEPSRQENGDESSGDEAGEMSEGASVSNRPIGIDELDIIFCDSHEYDGKPFRPSVEIKYMGADITDSSSVSYSNDAAEPGDYKLTVSMHGNYYGSRDYEYHIFPQSTRLEMEKNKDEATFSWNKCSFADGYELEISENEDFTDALHIDLDAQQLSVTVDIPEAGAAKYARVRSYMIISGQKKNKRCCSYWSNTQIAARYKITRKKGITFVDGVIIANKSYSLPADYGDGLSQETYAAFNEMSEAAREDGIWLYIASGFRSYETQARIYNSYVENYGKEETDRFSARPGYSEHQTGLAIDVNMPSAVFVGTPEAGWLAEHCAEYGFIIRYPEGKEGVTGYKYEPWHIRYLGRELAKKVSDSGLTLEEYFGIDSVYKN